MTVIAVDAMGGDHAPTEVIHGAVLAAREYDVAIQLVGPEKLLNLELEKLNALDLPIEVINADDVVDMGDKQPASSVRKKTNSSIVVAMNQVASGKAGGVISAGSTGATAAAALFCLKRLKNFERPCLSAVVPSYNGPIILADGGANVEATKEQLLQNAYMGTAMAKVVLKIKNPTVGLLNIGEEPGKGNSLMKETYELLASDKLINFIGNVEGRGVAEHACDVCVSDGFVGNIFLKTAEGYSKLVNMLLRDELNKDMQSKLAALFCKPSFKRLRNRFDYSEYGGGQLLGVNGVCVVAHGSSKHTAIKNAVRIAKEAVDCDLVKITESFVNSTITTS